jgi:Outer membrane protein beta-barrel family
MAETNLNFNKKNLNYLVSLYGRYTENVITNIAYPKPEDPTVLINTFMNGKSSYSYGLENTIRLTFFKNLNLTLTANTNYIVINASDGRGNDYYNKGFSYEGKLMASYKFPYDITFQANANYDGPKPMAQGTMREMYFFDLSLVKSVKQRLVFNLSVSDVTNTKRRLMYYDTPYYVQEMARRRESRYVKFSVTWMFGKIDASVFKKRNTNRNGRESNEGMDF